MNSFLRTHHLNSVEVDRRANMNVDYPQETLILLLELLLIEDLNCKYTVRVDFPASTASALRPRRMQASNSHIKTLIPVGVQRLLDDTGRAGLLAIDGGHSEGIRESCIRAISNPSFVLVCFCLLHLLKTSRLYRPSAAMTAMHVSICPPSLHYRPSSTHS